MEPAYIYLTIIFFIPIIVAGIWISYVVSETIRKLHHWVISHHIHHVGHVSAKKHKPAA